MKPMKAVIPALGMAFAGLLLLMAFGSSAHADLRSIGPLNPITSGCDYQRGNVKVCETTLQPSARGARLTAEADVNGDPEEISAAGAIVVAERPFTVGVDEPQQKKRLAISGFFRLRGTLFTDGLVTALGKFEVLGQPSCSIVKVLSIDTPSSVRGRTQDEPLRAGCRLSPDNYTMRFTLTLDSGLNQLSGPTLEADGFATLFAEIQNVVGGISVDPDVGVLPLTEEPLGTAQSSGANAGMLAGIAAAIAAGAVALGGAAWYARRRLR